jgi:hypothetical protein
MAWRWLACGGVSLLAPSPLRGEGWDEGRVLRRPSLDLAFGVGLVARLLTCGGLSLACRPASYFSLLAQREVAKRNGLWSPPTLQALGLEVVWNRRGSSCSTGGHTAPSPFTEGGAGVSWIVVSSPASAWRALQFGVLDFCLRCHEPSRLRLCPSSRRRPGSSDVSVRLSRRPTAPATGFRPAPE